MRADPGDRSLSDPSGAGIIDGGRPSNQETTSYVFLTNDVPNRDAAALAGVSAFALDVVGTVAGPLCSIRRNVRTPGGVFFICGRGVIIRGRGKHNYTFSMKSFAGRLPRRNVLPDGGGG